MIRSKVVSAVIEDIAHREQVGLKKYGVSLDRGDLTADQWLQHLYEELLDAACYVKKQQLDVDLKKLSPRKLIALKENYLLKIKQIDNEFRERG